ncbi:MAG: dihydrofolate reductase [Spirochaetales bacterium]|nr:MAG: dihydrofolate reductase [Spirochaetales bacterium]
MSNYVYIATSLDGFIAEKDGGLEWLTEYPNPDGSDFGYADFMQTLDVIVMGRVTFETVLSFGQWPYNKPVWVMSRTLVDVPPDTIGKAMIVDGGPLSVLEQAHTAGYENVYVDGGSVIRSFLNEDLIDEMIITIVPVALGEGIPLFTQLSRRLQFSLEKSETLIGQFVRNHYVRVR